jgi:alanyl-tRNA synthetase
MLRPFGQRDGQLVAAVGRSGLQKGLKAGAIIKAAAKLLGGGGGGKSELAQGGPDAAKLRRPWRREGRR